MVQLDAFRVEALAIVTNGQGQLSIVQDRVDLHHRRIGVVGDVAKRFLDDPQQLCLCPHGQPGQLRGAVEVGPKAEPILEVVHVLRQQVPERVVRVSVPVALERRRTQRAAT